MSTSHHRPHPAPIPFDGSWQYELRFPCDPRAPGVARLTLRAVLAAHGLGQLADRAELLACELATNSVVHTMGPAAVRLDWRHPVLRVSVWDPGPELPKPCGGPRPVPAPDVEDGRGLLLVATLADRWSGCRLGGGDLGPGGKTMWFELLHPPGSPQPPQPRRPSDASAPHRPAAA
ncbi:ATP-binding protein [Streptomyces sp. 4N509B]|uniref:ATP-binding protein n=1 Tax=Streptomyces sp. 4N509B TaxID=3457413 RepID=UPI003FD48902